MNEGEFVKLNCRRATLEALAAHLSAFGPTDGAPEWLVSGVWLCTDAARYLATAYVEVLADGFIARSLCIGTADELAGHIEAELPDIAARLQARANNIALPAPLDEIPSPKALQHWPAEPYGFTVLMRRAQRQSSVNRVACGLLFTSADGRALLVGSDLTTLAMVLSEDEELIGRYRQGCEELSLSDYLDLTDG